jgi:hypothetical protein
MMHQPPTTPLAKVEVQCQSWPEFAKKLNGFSGDWVLRGQREAAWSAETTLERHAPSVQARLQSEATWRKEFERRAHFYLQPQQLPTTKIEWLALMQHHGAPTRLLDFTRSAYVAAYFALEDRGDGDRCGVLAIDRTWCAIAAGRILAGDPHGYMQKTIDDLFGEDDDEKTLAILTAGAIVRDDKLFARRVLHGSLRFVLPVEPVRLSERLSIQQGTFMCPGDARASFMENLEAMPGWEDHVRHITLPFTERGRALEDLRKMNITRTSLFPGLDGFAQSFRNSLEQESTEQRRIRQAIEGLTDAIERRDDRKD